MPLCLLIVIKSYFLQKLSEKNLILSLLLLSKNVFIIITINFSKLVKSSTNTTAALEHKWLSVHTFL